MPLIVFSLEGYMETKDFSPDFLNARILSIISYDTVCLDIAYPTGHEIKECKLFRITKQDVNASYYKDVLNHLTTITLDKQTVKIKILKERRHNRAETMETIMMYSEDTKQNINDHLLKFIKEDKDNYKIAQIISKLRTKKE